MFLETHLVKGWEVNGMGSWHESAYSNLQELTNLLETVIQMGNENLLTQTENFLFTDNKMAEDLYYNGSLTNSILFELVLKLRKEEI